jgi:hypothetical protein
MSGPVARDEFFAPLGLESDEAGKVPPRRTPRTTEAHGGEQTVRFARYLFERPRETPKFVAAPWASVVLGGLRGEVWLACFAGNAGLQRWTCSGRPTGKLGASCSVGSGRPPHRGRGHRVPIPRIVSWSTCAVITRSHQETRPLYDTRTVRGARAPVGYRMRFAGKYTSTVVPTPLTLRIVRRPPCISAIRRASGKPRPVPS